MNIILKQLLSLVTRPETIEKIINLLRRKKKVKPQNEEIIMFEKDDVVVIKTDEYNRKWKVLNTTTSETKIVAIKDNVFGGVKITVPVAVLRKFTIDEPVKV